MILYFTGTGNSRHIAERLADLLGDEVININKRIKTNDNSTIETDERLIVVAPTYAWRMPLIVEEWLSKTSFSGAKSMWFVMDCGGEIGNAPKYNRTVCEGKGLIYKGTFQIVMPENYVAMFDVPNETESRNIVSAADKSVDMAAATIANNDDFPVPRNNAYDKIMSDIVNPIFYRFFVKAKQFDADSRCVGCGKCVELCPLNNITLKDGKPNWGNNCTHCMACICYCPTEAIEYGKKSVGKRRYRCE